MGIIEPLPSWARYISFNYRGNAVIMDNTGEIRREIVVDLDKCDILLQ